MKKLAKTILSVVTALAMTSGLTAAVQAETAEEFVKFTTTNLDFESESAIGHSVGNDIEGSTSGNTPYEIVMNGDGELAPQNGNGALYLGGTKYVSAWGNVGLSPDNMISETGELISGTYWIKIMCDKPYPGWKLPNIRIYTTRDGVDGQIDLAVTKDINEYSVWNLQPYTWTKLELESTGEVYDASCNELSFNIETTGQPDLAYYIDNIEIGTYREYELEDDSDVFDLLNFEDPNAFEGGIYDKSGALTFVNNDAEHPAYKGKGALLIENSKGGFSLWGGTKAEGIKEGSTISGTVALRLEQKKYDQTEPASNWYKFPTITISNGDGELLAKFDPMTIVYDELEQFTWFEADIVSTGKTFSAGDELQWNITNTAGSGIVCMMDSINLKITQPKDPEPIPPTVMHMSELENDVEVSEDGSFSKGFVSSDTFKISEYSDVIFKFPAVGDEAEKLMSYPIYELGTTITGDVSIMLGIQLVNIPEKYYENNQDIEVYLSSPQQSSID